MIRLAGRGDHKDTIDALKKVLSGDIFSDLDAYGRMGVDALRNATPVDTGLTAESWHYRITGGESPVIEWYNTNVISDGTPVAILIQYGHGTGTGGYVVGRDYINPAMRPIFDKIADDVWKKVSAA